MRPRMTMSMGFTSSNQGESGVLVAPGVADPGILRIVGGGHGAGRAGEGVQVVDVVAVGGGDGVVALWDQDEFAVAHGDGFVDAPVGRVDLLDGVAFGAIDAVIVNLFEVHLTGGIMDVVFVGRVTGPVAAGRVDLADEDAVGGKAGLDHVVDLAGG